MTRQIKHQRKYPVRRDGRRRGGKYLAGSKKKSGVHYYSLDWRTGAGLIVTESAEKIKVYPFLGDMASATHESYASFDDFIDRKVKPELVGRSDPPVPLVSSQREFLNELEKKYGRPRRVSWKTGYRLDYPSGPFDENWFAYEFIKTEKDEVGLKEWMIPRLKTPPRYWFEEKGMS